MRRRWFWLPALIIAGMLGLSAACGDDEGGGGSTGGDQATPRDTATEEAGATEDAGGEGGDEREFSGIIAGVEDDTIGGTVIISEGDAGAVDVEVGISGLPEGAHANHLHHGTCDEQGEIHVPLEELDASAQGSASGTTTFADPPLGHFADVQHYYAVHEGDDSSAGAVIGCANIEQSQ